MRCPECGALASKAYVPPAWDAKPDDPVMVRYTCPEGHIWWYPPTTGLESDGVSST